MNVMDGQTIVPQFSGSDFKPFWEKQITIEDYHARKEFVSSGGLKYVLQSPEHFYYQICSSSPPTRTSPDMELGQLVHAALLEPDRFSRNLVLEPDHNRRSSIERAKIAEWTKAQGPEKIIVTKEDLNIIYNIRMKIEKNETARGLLTCGRREWSGFARDERTGLMVRARPDFMVFADDVMIDGKPCGRTIIMDVKTTRDASYGKFRFQIEDLRFELSAYMYMKVVEWITGQKVDDFFWLAIEKKPPYALCLHKMDQAYEEGGEYFYEVAMDKLKKCIETGVWPGYQESAQYIHPTDRYLQMVSAGREQKVNEDAMIALDQPEEHYDNPE